MMQKSDCFFVTEKAVDGVICEVENGDCPSPFFLDLAEWDCATDSSNWFAVQEFSGHPSKVTNNFHRMLMSLFFLLVLSADHRLKYKRYNKSKVQIKQLVKKRKMKKTGLTNI